MLPGVSASDKYLRLQREQESARRNKKSKDKKKRKRKGKKGRVDSESEDDIPVLHSVSSAFDAPEGAAALSDNDMDDRHKNDPHKLLDINLDE